MKRNKMVVIEPERSKEFLQEWNKNLVSEEFMKSCRKTEELFERHKSSYDLSGDQSIFSLLVLFVSDKEFKGTSD